MWPCSTFFVIITGALIECQNIVYIRYVIGNMMYKYEEGAITQSPNNVL